MPTKLKFTAGRKNKEPHPDDNGREWVLLRQLQYSFGAWNDKKRLLETTTDPNKAVKYDFIDLTPTKSQSPSSNTNSQRSSVIRASNSMLTNALKSSFSTTELLYPYVC